jgi:phosphate transport system substrate-binding protein
VAGIFGRPSNGQTGTVRWAEVGLNGMLGSALINRYGREATSGTFAAFRDMRLDGLEQRRDVRSEPESIPAPPRYLLTVRGVGFTLKTD